MGPEPIKMEDPAKGRSPMIWGMALTGDRYGNEVTDPIEHKPSKSIVFAGLCFVAGFAFGAVSFMLIAMYGG